MATPLLESWLLRLLWIAVLVVMAALNLQQAEAGVHTKNSVKVRNELPRTLAVHCKSGDEDRGIHYVAPGQAYAFEFDLNFWQTTEYWCRFVDGPRWNSFGVWTPPGAWLFPHRVPCWRCLWVARVDGFWRAEEGRSLAFLQPWRQDRGWNPPSAAPTSRFHIWLAQIPH